MFYEMILCLAIFYFEDLMNAALFMQHNKLKEKERRKYVHQGMGGGQT